jgi:hypothetical protein
MNQKPKEQPAPDNSESGKPNDDRESNSDWENFIGMTKSILSLSKEELEKVKKRSPMKGPEESN